MATAGVPLWSTTAASNSTADPAVNWAEGQAPSSVNDSARAMMASVAGWRNDLWGITTGGTATAYTVATAATFATAAAMSGAVFTIVPHATSGAAPTLAVDGLTARAINVATGVAIPTGYLIASTPYLVKYVHATTEFIVLGAAGIIAAAAGTVSVPAYTFSADQDTGIYRIGANNIGVAANGAKVLDIATTGLSVTGTLAASSATTVTSTSADALTVGANGATNPVLKVNANTASVATGISVTGAAAAGGVAVAAISSGANENLKIDAKGSGTVTINGTATGAVTITPATTITGALTANNAAGVTAKNTAKAWGHVTISGGTPTLQESFNVTSITRNSTGNYTITFTNALASATFAAVVSALQSDAGGGGNPPLCVPITQTTTTLRFIVKTSTSLFDPEAFSFMVMGA